MRPSASAASAAIATTMIITIATAGTHDGCGVRVQQMVDSSSQFDYAASEEAGTATLTIGTLGCEMVTRSEP